MRTTKRTTTIYNKYANIYTFYKGTKLPPRPVWIMLPI